MTLGLDSPTPAPTNPWHGFGFASLAAILLKTHILACRLAAVKTVGLTKRIIAIRRGIAGMRENIATATVLRCRIRGYSSGQGTRIATVKPTDLLGATCCTGRIRWPTRSNEKSLPSSMKREPEVVTALSPREDSGRLLRVGLNPISSGNPPAGISNHRSSRS